VRRHVMALYNVAADVAAIPARVSEPGPGEIRLQWWRDALEGEAHGAIAANPFAAAFLKTLKTNDLPTGPLVRLIAARRFDLYQDPMPDMETFEGYAGETVSTIIQYAAAILCGGAMPENGDAAGHLGVATALIGHLRAFGYNAARGRIFLPLSIFTAHGVTDQQILAGNESKELAGALSAVREAATAHLDLAEQALPALSPPAGTAMISIPVLRTHLNRLEKANAPFSVPQDPADWHKLWMMWRWAARHASG